MVVQFFDIVSDDININVDIDVEIVLVALTAAAMNANLLEGQQKLWRSFYSPGTKQSGVIVNVSGNSPLPARNVGSFRASIWNTPPQAGQVRRRTCELSSFRPPARQSRRNLFSHFGQVATAKTIRAFYCSPVDGDRIAE